MINKKIKKTAIETAREAGDLLLERFLKFNRHRSKLKSDMEIVTRADFKSEKVIISRIKKDFPTHKIISEEAGELKNKKEKIDDDYLWVVDPLDGTTNFSMHNPLWSVSIGIFKDSEIVFGVVYAPFLDELFVAEKDKGAKLNNKKIKVSDISQQKVLNTFCHGSTKRDVERAIRYYNYQKLHGFDCRQLGSAAIELAFVATGRIESIVIPGANSWDVAAGALLVREARGRVTDFSGKDWNIKSKDIAASNGLVHKQIMNALKK